MLPELKTLRELQTLDLRIARLDRALAAVPGALAAIDDRIEAARSRWAAAEEELRNRGADHRRAEGELEDAEASVSKYSDQLFTVKDNEAYSDLQGQIAATKEKIVGIEDRILALMEAVDRLEGEVVEHKRDFEAKKAVLEKEKDTVRAEAREKERKRDALWQQRAVQAARLPGDIAGRYETVRGARHGLAVAPTSEDRCSACNVRLRPQLFEEIRTGGSIHSCESCSRILFFEPEPAAASTP